MKNSDDVQVIDEQQEVLTLLNSFLSAFKNGDLDVMEASFAASAVTFPRSIMSNGNNSQIKASDFKRITGIDPQMGQLIASLREGSAGPPYMMLEPKDLEVQMFTDAALVTFHIENRQSLSRRTFVLFKERGGMEDYPYSCF